MKRCGLSENKKTLYPVGKAGPMGDPDKSKTEVYASRSRHTHLREYSELRQSVKKPQFAYRAKGSF